MREHDDESCGEDLGFQVAEVAEQGALLRSLPDKVSKCC